MSKNRNRAKLMEAQNNHQYQSILMGIKYPLYWDEGINFYYRKKNKAVRKHKKREIYVWQVRMYKTWKHNRKTQYKPMKKEKDFA